MGVRKKKVLPEEPDGAVRIGSVRTFLEEMKEFNVEMNSCFSFGAIQISVTNSSQAFTVNLVGYKMKISFLRSWFSDARTNSLQMTRRLKL